MTLESEQMLSHYRLAEKIGEGGMGVVWKADDTKLGRSVAIKVLPELFSSDPERLARFEREAKLLAALNHPNIAAIHGLDEVDTSTGSVRFLVLELVDGENLDQRIRRGALPAEEALDIGRQIAEALEAAHQRGILHRDLKPANVKITPEGKVKVLDFGLAKAVEPASGDTSLSASPTLTTGGTQQGVIMGTAAYMSPEQARGRPVDKRADVWAFGCVLYECLTGRQIFGGETITDILGAILHREPDWKLLSPSLPPAVPRLLRRCLQRDARQRLHDIADARIILEEGDAEGAVEMPEEAAGRRGPGALALAAGAVVLAAAGFLAGRMLLPVHTAAPHAGGEVRFIMRHTPTQEASVQAAPASTQGTAASRDGSGPDADALGLPVAGFEYQANLLALSRDGRRMVYGVRDPDGVSRLYLREMGQLQAQAIRGTENGRAPFLSPDGEWVGFAASGELRTVRVTGGTPRALVHLGTFKGGTWTDDEEILFAPDADAGIHRIPADGGASEILTRPDPELGERTHRWPQTLPDGKGFLMTVGMSTIATFDDADIAVWVAETGKLKTLFKGGMFARYVDSGHLVFARDNSLFAAPFDLDSLEVTGRAELVVEDVVTEPLTGATAFAVSRNATLAYVHGRQVEAYTVRSFDMEGNVEVIIAEPDYFNGLDISPDGKFLALSVDGANSHVWIHDLERQARSRLTFEWNNILPVWTPDGQHIAYARGRAGASDLFWTRADGGGEQELLLATPFRKRADSFSPDGKVLAFVQVDPGTGDDIWLLDMDQRTAKPFLQTPFYEGRAAFSPDGQWIAYDSDETGRDEVFVRPYPGPGAKWQISVDGGRGQGWAPDGRSILFGQGGTIYRVRIDTTSGFRAGRPEALFDIKLDARDGDLRPDGSGFIFITKEEAEAPATEIRVLVNWSALRETS